MPTLNQLCIELRYACDNCRAKFLELVNNVEKGIGLDFEMLLERLGKSEGTCEQIDMALEIGKILYISDKFSEINKQVPCLEQKGGHINHLIKEGVKRDIEARKPKIFGYEYIFKAP